MYVKRKGYLITLFQTSYERFSTLCNHKKMIFPRYVFVEDESL